MNIPPSSPRASATLSPVPFLLVGCFAFLLGLPGRSGQCYACEVEIITESSLQAARAGSIGSNLTASAAQSQAPGRPASPGPLRRDKADLINQLVGRPISVAWGGSDIVGTRVDEGNASPNQVVSLSLREYIEIIAAESPKILASRLDEAAADCEARSAYAAYLPHIVGTAQVGYIKGKRLEGLEGPFNNLPTSSGEQREFTQEGPGLTVPVFKEGSFLGINVPPEVARKRAERQVIKFEGLLTEQNIILSATEAYLQAIKASHSLEFRTQHFALAQKEAARVENRATTNLATAEELGEARLLLETSRASFEAARGEAIYSFLAVAALLGRDVSAVRIEDTYPEPAPLPDFETIAGVSSVEHPKVRMQEASIRGAQADLARQRSRLFPSIMADSFDSQFGDFHGQAANQWASVISVKVPVFDFGEAALATKSAGLKVRAENERRIAVQQDLQKDLVDAVLQIKQSAGSLAKAQSDVAEKRRVAVRLESLSKLDQALLGELNSAELKLLEAKEALEQARYDLLFRYALYQKVTAGGWKWIAR